MIDAYRVEHMFKIVGGATYIVPGLARHRSWVNRAGAPLALLPPGLDREARADILAAAILRHAADRLEPRELLALFGRAFRRPIALPVRCTAASVATWIPEG